MTNQPAQPAPRVFLRWAVALFALSLVIRVAWGLAAESYDPMLRANPLLGDAAAYDRLAQSLVAGTGLAEEAGHPTSFWPPGYPLFLAAVYSVVGHSLIVARLAQAVVASLLPLAVFVVGTMVFSRRVAVIAGLAAAVYPGLIYFGAWLIAESLYFGLLGLWLWISARLQQRPSVVLAALWGAIAAAAVLTKPTTLMHLPFWGAWMLVALPVPATARLKLAATAFAVLALVMAPWVARNYAVFGSPMVGTTSGGFTFYGANNAEAFGGHKEGFPPPIPGLSAVEQDREYYRLASRWIVDHPGDFARLLGRKFARLVSPLSVASSPVDYAVPGEWLLRIAYAAFLLTALVGGLRHAREKARWFLLIPIAGVITSTAIFYGDVRYTLPAVPSLVLFAAAGLPNPHKPPQ